MIESSLDFAASLEPRKVIEAVVERLVALLDVSACDIHVLEPGGEAVRTVVSYDDGKFDFGDVIGRVWSLHDFHLDRTRRGERPARGCHEPRRPGLNDAERRLLQKNGKTSQLGVPLKVRDRVIGVVELFDDKDRQGYSPEDIELVEAICQFAALALDNARLFDSQRDTSGATRASRRSARDPAAGLADARASARRGRRRARGARDRSGAAQRRRGRLHGA